MNEVIFVYNAYGQLISKYSNELVNPKVNYLTSDHLGSPRIITDEAGTVFSRHDYMAFGDEVMPETAIRTIVQGYNSTDEVRQQYTGYERDTESGLDYAKARYYNSKHGRFTSVDPLTASATIRNPQTFNRYTYTLNSPYKFTDPLGLLPENMTKGMANSGPYSTGEGFSNYDAGGRVVENVLNSDSELSAVQSKKNQNSGFWNYALYFNYTPVGAVYSMRLGNWHWESTEFNSRLQPTPVVPGTTPNGSDLLKLDFTSITNDNNGNVRAQTITVPATGNNHGFTTAQFYTYDSLNRIKQASKTIGGNQMWRPTFTYDRCGNRNFDTTNRQSPLDSGSLPKAVNPEIQNANNRVEADQGGDGITDYLYDAAGNTTEDAQHRIFVCDAGNKLIEILENNVSVDRYFYDGDGKQVKKITAHAAVIFVYDAAGKLIAEDATQLSQTLTNDHPGSPRISTNAPGAVISRDDYQPFGEETERARYGTDNIGNQFADYKKDKECDLDFAQARMYSKNHGRFTMIDPLLTSLKQSFPQAWNRYAYVVNEPHKYIDSMGHELCIAAGKTRFHDLETYLTARNNHIGRTKE